MSLDAASPKECAMRADNTIRAHFENTKQVPFNAAAMYGEYAFTMCSNTMKNNSHMCFSSRFLKRTDVLRSKAFSHCLPGVESGEMGMSVIHEISGDGKNVLITVEGRFDYKVSQDFRDAYRNVHAQEGMTYHVNLNATDFMDSSALGMLLLLREHAKCRGGKVIIEHPSKQIDKILRVANFEQLFAISVTPTINDKVGYELSGRH